jgi:hypothetical protein
LAQIGRVDFHARQEGEDDGRERGDEVEPLLGLEVEDVPDDDAERQLDQGDGDAELDRRHTGDEDDDGEDCGKLDGLHGCLLLGDDR